MHRKYDKKKILIVAFAILTFLSQVYFIYFMIFKYSVNVISYTTDFPVTVINTSNTQAILKYDSPTGLMCTIKVSELADMSILVNDVNPTLFTDANKDTRDTSIIDGNSRVVVLGKRLAEEALDGNYYSRALQAYTVHYYEIRCGSQISSGSFQTKTIPTGLTYSDTIRGKEDGSQAWPTILDNRDQVIIDPQTGLKINRLSLTNDSDTSPGVYPGEINFGASASSEACNSTMVTDYTGATGYHCLVGSVLFWVNPTTGIGRPVGAPANTLSGSDGSNFTGFQFCSFLDTVNPNTFYCIVNTNGDIPVLVKLVYSGQNTFLNDNLPNCEISTPPCYTRTILTPPAGNKDIKNLIQDFDQEYDLNGNIEIKAIQNGKIILQILKSIQDSYAWLAVFDPGNGLPVGSEGSTAGIIAAMSTYKNYPIRWCSSHGVTPIGDTDWMFIGSNYLRGNSDQPGYGMYTSNIVSGNLPATTNSCPANPFGDTQCTDIIVDGEPCDESENPQIFNAKCGNPAHSYLQDAEVGDIFGINPTTRGRFYREFVRIIEKNGNNWKIGRGLNQTTIISHDTGALDAACTAHDTEQENYDLTNWVWDYVNDPHGTGNPGTTIVYDKNGTGGHGAYRPNKMLEIMYPPKYQLRSGAVPDFINATKVILDDANPAFSGIQGVGYPNTVDSHPSPFYNDQFALDGRPYNSGGIEYSGSATSLGSGIYKYGVGVIPINRKKMTTIAHSGMYILKDISAPDSNINTASDHSYCVVVNPGECNSGSLAGEVYVKSTTATVSNCPYPGIAQTGWGQQHICIGDNAMYNQAIAQIGPTVRTNGKNGRMLTHGLTRYNRQDLFWNVRATPDGAGMLFSLPIDASYGEGSGQLFFAKLPPFTVDAHIRDDFVNTTVEVPNSTNDSATSASVLFGYTEEGLASDYFCTSRNESCIRGSHSGVDYDFGSTTSSRVSCADGCDISVPIIPSRVAYMQIQYHDSDGAIIATSTPLVTISEYPYTVVTPVNTTESGSGGQEDSGSGNGGGQGGTSNSGSGGSSSGSSRRNSTTASVILSTNSITDTIGNNIKENTDIMSKPLGLVFTRRIVTKTKGDDVAQIQKILATRKDIYPEGLITGYYGPLTTKAIKRFQLMYKVTRPHIYGYGIIGPLTINKMNQIFSTTTINSSE